MEGGQRGAKGVMYAKFDAVALIKRQSAMNKLMTTTSLTAPQKIIRHIFKREFDSTDEDNYLKAFIQEFDEDDDILIIWEALDELVRRQFLNKFKDEPSAIKIPNDIGGLVNGTIGNFQVRIEAQQLICGSWVAYSVYFGGGKHADPNTISWLDDAIDVYPENRFVTELKQIWSA